MKFICKVSMNVYRAMPGVRVYFPKVALELIGKEIVFNINKLKIKRPTIDSTKVYSFRNHQFTFCPQIKEREDYIGNYSLMQKNEDTFYLVKA